MGEGDLEKELRQRQFYTYLAAVPPLKGYSLVWVGQDEPQRKLLFECLFICRPPPRALQEVLLHWPAYEYNLAALSLAGSLQRTKMSPDQDANVDRLPKDENRTLDDVSHNRVRWKKNEKNQEL